MQNILSKYAKILRGHFLDNNRLDAMKIELIPVLEIVFYNEDVPSPQDATPYWEHVEIWDNFYEKQHVSAGLTDKLTAHSKGIPYYALSSISDDNLAVFILRGTEDMTEVDFDHDEAPLFQGGYVLRVNDEDISFPQCCCSLNDISAYQELVTDAPCDFYQGHPSPMVQKEKNKIILDFKEEQHGESFYPPVKTDKITLDKEALKAAIEVAIQQVNAFSARLERVNDEKKLGIKNIDKAFYIKS
jgi:hypothetical protein